ncbi:UbiA prenyltransferase family protein [Diplocloster modestus]|uniref:UbiA prenyltransferase family protein n=1 Tax=Diplocloster modestus TaxID=2850322 RepID=A0ABS6K149_9FIRM|nr:UbiA prenyltransferase family protein [Diplocloster modestus]MBU9724573.1 UbiA prenyltransferase family protein [Diplocloster modestus]
MNQLKSYIKIARPDHWVKNAFIVPGVIIAELLTGKVFDSGVVIRFIWGFMATCFIASANYVINEWLDAKFDKYHPTKKNRPVVVSNIKFHWVMVEYALLIILGVICSIQVNRYFLYMELWLLLMGVLYNVRPIRTKDIPYIDVLSESLNNLIRLLIGWFIITESYQPPSSVLVGYWMCGAYLMATKRYAEYRMIGDPEVAGKYRKSFKYYTEHTLLVSAFFYAMSATFFLGVFMMKYKIELLIAMPFVFGLFCYYLYLSFKEDSAVQKPEKLYKEKGLLIYIVILIALIAVLMYSRIPAMDYFVETMLLNV